MASLKHNGPELARLVFERTDSDGLKHTHHLSVGARGYVLRRIDVVYRDGNRVKGAWKRHSRFATHDGPPAEELAPTTADNLRTEYTGKGWLEIAPET